MTEKRLTRIVRPLRRLFGDTRGTYLLEFAMISLPMATLLMGGIELGYHAYAKAKVEGALREVSRLAATGSATPEELDLLLNQRIDKISNATAEIETRSYSTFAEVDQPEPLTSDVAPLGGAPDVGDCFLDVKANETWDDNVGEDGLGGSEDILYYGVTVTYPMLFGLTSTIINGGHSDMTIEANAVIKNEPFGEADIPDPQEVCICPPDRVWEDGACRIP
jgi:Flp pilus assembly protein TadG